MNIEKEKRAIQILRTFEPQDEPYWLCYSGGKDSDTISILAQLAGVKYERHYNNTTVDSPVTVKYIKSQSDVIIDNARWPDGRHKTMSNLIENKGMLPTRIMRYCCSELKEASGKGHLKITGVRAMESVKRTQKAGLIKIFGKFKTSQKIAEANGAEHINSNNNVLVLNFDDSAARRTVEQCYRTTSTIINPILDWSEDDVWSFLKHYGCDSNPEYQCGFHRIGCVGCPMANKNRIRDFKKYPKFFGVYYRAAKRIFDFNSYRIKVANDPLSYMIWWLEYGDFDEFLRDYAEIAEICGIDLPKSRQLSLFDMEE